VVLELVSDVWRQGSADGPASVRAAASLVKTSIHLFNNTTTVLVVCIRNHNSIDFILRGYISKCDSWYGWGCVTRVIASASFLIVAFSPAIALSHLAHALCTVVPGNSAIGVLSESSCLSFVAGISYAHLELPSTSTGLFAM